MPDPNQGGTHLLEVVKGSLVPPQQGPQTPQYQYQLEASQKCRFSGPPSPAGLQRTLTHRQGQVALHLSPDEATSWGHRRSQGL